jgi:hypothetical protein
MEYRCKVTVPDKKLFPELQAEPAVLVPSNIAKWIYAGTSGLEYTIRQKK